MAKRITATGCEAHLAVLDALDDTAVNSYVDSIVKQTGKIDIILEVTGPLKSVASYTGLFGTCGGRIHLLDVTQSTDQQSLPGTETPQGKDRVRSAYEIFRSPSLHVITLV